MSQRARYAHIKTSVASLGVLVMLTGCTTLPGSTAPEVVSSYASSPSLEEVAEPTPGNPADLMLRDFFSASAHPLVNHEAARRFLTPEAAQNWKTGKDIFILDRIDIASNGSASANKVTYAVRGNLIGSMGVGGVYHPMFTGYETTYDMVKVNGEWRIANLPDAVVVDRSDFTSAYQPHPIYYLGPQGQHLVADRRWVYTRQQSLSSSLISLLTAGPQENLQRGVRTLIPHDATVQTRSLDDGGVSVDFTGMTGLNQQERDLVAAQVVWTLASSDVRGPYVITADGSPLSEQNGREWQVEDVSKLDPQADIAMPLRAVLDGQIVDISENQPTPMSGWVNGQYNESVAVSPQGSVFAVVTGRGDSERKLLVGAEQEQPQTVVTADSLTRPTWGSDADTIYTVVDGKQVVRLVRRELGAIERSNVDMGVLRRVDGKSTRISMFRIFRDGVHAVMLINGRVYTTVLENDDDGGKRLGALTQVGNQLGDTAISVDWQPDGSLLVGTRSSDAPLWQVAADGSISTQLPSRNLSAPVVAVAATSTVVYATDARALMQLNNMESDRRFWREVPALQGQRAVAVLAN
ncbi:MtrAB system accessory lipoprotein LpqB [Corynebacterium anserum]|uniref:Lipoprotein LpqB n=1 Tax=Corynebacterium anserum TaxID=2684406 RepID=A0A7G7YPN9_9CORY|nr:MtrAB system accessory lipoprotein LpqB [Corynebacterium anserum]QNH96459.1 MtrAB system accessory protein LpqB [Corynebacterium anserum]